MKKRIQHTKEINITKLFRRLEMITCVCVLLTFYDIHLEADSNFEFAFEAVIKINVVGILAVCFHNILDVPESLIKTSILLREKICGIYNLQNFTSSLSFLLLKQSILTLNFSLFYLFFSHNFEGLSFAFEIYALYCRQFIITNGVTNLQYRLKASPCIFPKKTSNVTLEVAISSKTWNDK